MDELELYKLVVYRYYVIFESKASGVSKYQAIIKKDLGSYVTRNDDTMHMWDSELDPIIPALWYILHLPRNGFDTVSCDIDLLMHSHDEPHNTIVIPYIREQKNTIKNLVHDPTIIICADDIFQDINDIIGAENTTLGIYRISELSSELLRTHWDNLSNFCIAHEKDSEPCVVDLSFRLLKKDERKILPLVPLANQFGYTKQLIEEIEKLNKDNNHNRYALAMHHRVLDIVYEISKRDNRFKKYMASILRETPIFSRVPLVITFPGTMGYQIRKFNRAVELPENEREIVEILGLHRAAAKHALHISLDGVPQEMYTELARLEEHCKDARKISNKYVWRSLEKIGKLLAEKLEGAQVDIINQVSQITVFSDFPIGLAILPDCSAPLCCIKPISYRTLTPLTRAVQYEMSKSNQIYLGKKLKVIIAECVSKTDVIRSACDGLTRSILDITKGQEGINVIVEEISSIKDFKKMLNSQKDADILLISAHGNYNIDSNMAGLCIGNEVWMADDDDLFVPPVVLLSACHVMPRGRGVVTVGDLFLRAGAKTVLGTFIPVDVYRNAVLIVRLFTEIIEVRKGWSNMRTLDEIWSHIVCTNPIHEIISSMNGGVSKLERWANTRREDGSLPQEDFKMKDSVGRLRCTHAYEDTVNILREIAYRDGIGEYYDAYIESSGFFPESVFYQLIGTPENVFFRNEVVEEYDCKNL